MVHLRVVVYRLLQVILLMIFVVVSFSNGYAHMSSPLATDVVMDDAPKVVDPGIGIDILNVQSYPSVGGNWTVEFNTNGTADLIITATNGTTWSDAGDEEDLELLEVRCGDEVLDYTWIDETNSILIENYSCDKTGYETSRVHTYGKHHLEFRFGDDVDYAHNLAVLTVCGATLSTPNEVYVLGQDVNTSGMASGTCFIIGADGITIDGQGYMINYTTDVVVGNAIRNAGGFDNINIKNLRLVQNKKWSSGAHAIYADGMTNSIINNVNIQTGRGSHGIYLVSSPSNTISGNTISTINGNGHGIYLDSSTMNTISGNVVSTAGISAYGIYLLSSGSSPSISNNVVTTTGSNGYGIYLSSSGSNSLSNNAITTTYTRGYGIFLSSSDSNTLSNNPITTLGSYGNGIYLSSSGSNTLSGNTITANGTYGYGVSLSSSDGNDILNNGISTSNAYGYGVFLLSSSNSKLSGNNMDTQSAYAIYVNPSATSSYYDHDIDTTNTEGGNPIYYYYNEDSQIIGGLGGVGQMYVTCSTNMTITNVVVNGDGIIFANTDNSYIVSSTVSVGEQYAVKGIHLYSSPNVDVSSNSVQASGSQGYGVYLQSSGSSRITFNTVSISGSYGHGVYLQSSGSSIITNNAVSTSGSYGRGVYLSSSGSSDLLRNSVTTLGSYSPGIYLSSSNSVKIEDSPLIRTLGAYSYGIHMAASRWATILDNTMNANNAYALYINPTTTSSYYDHTIDTDNTEQGRTIYYYYNKDSIDIQNLVNVGQLYVAYSRDVTIRNVDVVRDGITLAMTDDSRVESSTFTTGTQTAVNGIYLHSSSDSNNVSNNIVTVSGRSAYGIDVYSSSNSNTIFNNTITTTNMDGRGIGVISSSTNMVLTNKITTSGFGGDGVYLSTANSNTLFNNTVATSNANAYAVLLSSSGTNNVSGNDLKTVGIQSYGVSLVSSNVNNVSDNDIVTSNTDAYGISLSSSATNTLSNNSITTSGNGGRGISLSLSNTNMLLDNSIVTSNQDGYGISLSSSDTNALLSNDINTSGDDGYGVSFTLSKMNSVSGNNVTTSGSSAVGFRVESSSDSNTISDNAIMTSDITAEAFAVISSAGNNVSGGSIVSGASYDYYLENAGATNNFTRTNFTLREVRFNDAASWFNYVYDDAGDVSLRTQVSGPTRLTRKILIWNSCLVKWNETSSVAGITATYDVMGLLPFETYKVFVTSGGVKTNIGAYPSGASGAIAFAVVIPGNVEIEVNWDSLAPEVYINSYPDPVVSEGIVVFEVTCIDAGSGCDYTLISAGPYTCKVDHTAVPLQTNCSIKFNTSCEVNGYTYNVDSSDLSDNHNTSVSGMFDVKKEDGCECILPDECFNNSCFDFSICYFPVPPGVGFITPSTGNRVEALLGDSETIVLQIDNRIPVPDTIKVMLYASPLSAESWLQFSDSEFSDEYMQPRTKLVSLESKSGVRVPISFLAGKVGTYKVTVSAQSTLTGLISYGDFTVAVVKTSRDMSSETPGLSFVSVFFIFVFAVAVCLNRKVL